ncbi:2-isopropylmalate synthase [Phakopsora pachyrhizi]|uniref:2-isopropylmalate synthase n=1 Tax=Phakopsora pachyrhizi TaxID=170000 RepID=A0AAV0BEQ1_PHAPC|nr:2-isopropylmalate synthase [Phakopsora pachyrhizi]CAH7685722.1 2-isopropylmalate synthase [Phakopsora pachyrhizi]
MIRSAFGKSPVARFGSTATAKLMLNKPSDKYRPSPILDFPDRQWPGKKIDRVPRWCAVDLRDGNQSLVNPMTVEQKTRFFNLLLKTGFKEIEVGFPAASDTDFDFVRKMAQSDVEVPDDVAIQVLSPAREDLIRRTFDAIQNGKNVIFHMYNATSPLFRETVFQASMQKTIDLAVRHTELVRQLSDEAISRGDRTNWQFQYSPETFSQTEPAFAVEICEAVKNAWFKGKDIEKSNPIIFNLPATVEVNTPNVYADQIEYFCRNITDREHCHISLHTHNDRGTGVAATELGLLAGADRVEGCLFGNGERTGNVDLVTVALNMYSHGISPGLDFSDIKEVIDIVTECNDIPVHPRHPYSGDLVFTAFSGSHQDAIKKGFAVQRSRSDGAWNMPYLPIDPHDIGCDYEAVIRVNSQSGKGGVAYLVQEHLGLDMPRKMQVAFYNVVQDLADRTGREMTVEDVTKCFRTAYHLGPGNMGRYVLDEYSISNAPARPQAFDPETAAEDQSQVRKVLMAKILENGKEVQIVGDGNGPVSAMLSALRSHCGLMLDVVSYSEKAIGSGSETKAATYMELKDERGRHVWGVGVDADVTTSLLKSIMSAASTASISAQQRSDEIASLVNKR